MLLTDRLLDELVRHTGAFAEAVRATDPDAPVGVCPGWTVRDLAAHLGGVHRWAAGHVAEQRAKLVRRGDTDPPMPADPDAVSAWLCEGAALVVDAVRTTGDDTVVGGFGGPVPVRFWARRQCHETLVHRADAEIAAGSRPWEGVDAEVAADAVDEHLALIQLGAPKRTALHGAGESLHLHATDPDIGDTGEWVITRRPGDLTVEHGHRKADVALRAPATTLLGVLTSRLGPERGEVLGDRDLLEHWRTHAVL